MASIVRSAPDLAVALLVALAVASVPSALAGTAVPTTPASGGCVLMDTDSCAGTYSTGPGAEYVPAAIGAFTGTFTLSATDSFGISWTETCTGTLAGAVMATGGCVDDGAYRLSGLLEISCSSEGSGALACAVVGA